jgi:type IV secretion system protein VirB5
MPVRTRRIGTWLGFALLIATAPAVQAQFAVIDVASLTQLVSEVQTLEEQLATARSQLTQAQAQFQALTGDRGMEQLLSGIARNYLPADAAALRGAAQGGGTFAALNADVRAALLAESKLSNTQLAALPPQGVAQLQSQRQSAALLLGLTHEALANASGRFAALQQLIDSIGRANDPKAALDLQARISAEAGMLQNENTKLQVLFQAVHADEQADTQRTRELIIAGHGAFAGRFQPHP